MPEDPENAWNEQIATAREEDPKASVRHACALKKFYVENLDSIRAIIDEEAEQDPAKMAIKDRLVYDLISKGRWKHGEEFIAYLIMGSKFLKGTKLIGTTFAETIVRLQAATYDAA